MRGLALAWAVVGLVACGGDGATGRSGGSGASGAGGSAQGGSGGTYTGGGGWPEGNEYSWDGSWGPQPSEFPLEGLLDDEYFDGHTTGGEPSPILPPGEWDWDDASNDLANWRNFEDNLGTFARLHDGADQHFGWQLAPVAANVDFSGPAAYFEGSSGTDLIDLGPGGAIHSYGDGNLGDGPDVLIFDQSWSLDFRTGSSLSGSLRDNDLVIAGCSPSPDGGFDIETSTVHTGPGSDWVFVRDISRAAIDLGNGDGGRTDVVDPADGDDLAVVYGNAHDFRIMGGNGDDVVVWQIDDVVQTETWLGPNFFGGGGWADAVWGDDGTDRLVLGVPADTQIVTTTPTPEGALLVLPTSGDLVDDPPTAGDPFAHYCVECPVSATGRKTVILEYNALGGVVFTGYFYVSAFEELQVGSGDDARVFDIDDVNGALNERPDLDPFVPPSVPASYCQ